MQKRIYLSSCITLNMNCKNKGIFKKSSIFQINLTQCLEKTKDRKRCVTLQNKTKKRRPSSSIHQQTLLKTLHKQHLKNTFKTIKNKHLNTLNHASFTNRYILCHFVIICNYDCIFVVQFFNIWRRKKLLTLTNKDILC